MLIKMLLSGSSFLEIVINILFIALSMAIVLPSHEFAHAYMAYKLGDSSQKAQGRLTLNPLRHLDPLGAVCLLLTGFGWAKPVYVNVSLLNRGGRFATGWISLAGPAANLILGVVFAFFGALAAKLLPATSTFGYVLVNFLQIVFVISVNLAVFNLIPVPPLDGFGILRPALPEKADVFIVKYQRVFSIVFVVLLVTGALSTPIAYVSGLLQGLIERLVGLII